MNEINELKRRVEELERFIQSLQFSSKIPLGVDQAFRERFLKDVLSSTSGTLAVSDGGTGAITLTGILKGNGTSAITAIAPLAGSKNYWVSDTLNGANSHNITFTNGVLTGEP